MLPPTTSAGESLSIFFLGESVLLGEGWAAPSVFWELPAGRSPSRIIDPGTAIKQRRTMGFISCLKLWICETGASGLVCLAGRNRTERLAVSKFVGFSQLCQQFLSRKLRTRQNLRQASPPRRQDRRSATPNRAVLQHGTPPRPGLPPAVPAAGSSPPDE